MSVFLLRYRWFMQEAKRAIMFLNWTLKCPWEIELKLVPVR